MSSRVFYLYTPLSERYVPGFLEFLYSMYVLPRISRIREVFSAPGRSLRFKLVHPSGLWSVGVEVTAAKPIRVEVKCEGEAPVGVERAVREDIEFYLRLYEERLIPARVCFSWVGGEVAPEEWKGRRALGRLLTDNMLPFFILTMALSIPLFYLLGRMAPIALVALQLSIVLLAGRLMLLAGGMEVTDKTPNVYVVKYDLDVESYRLVLSKLGLGVFSEVKEDIYASSLAKGRPPSQEEVRQALETHGVSFSPDYLKIRQVDLYSIVKRVFERFKLPVPRILVINNPAPNAAAAGPGPSLGVLIVTSGLLLALEEDEVEAVIGHECSHLKARDPLIMFIMSSVEFLLRFYYLYWLAALFPFFYFPAAFGLIYFLAKFLEARADLDSAVKLRNPRTLARALTKIGYMHLYLETRASSRLQSWLRFDPHPPVYFRVRRLERIEDPSKIKHTMLRSIKDVLSAILAAERW